MKLTRLISVIIALAMVGSLVACSGAPAPSNSSQPVEAKGGNYIMATGGTSGTYYPLGGAMAQIIAKYVPNTNVTPNATGASKENIRLVSSGDADIAIVQNDVLDYASKGIEIFNGEKVSGLTVLATLYPEVCQVVVGADSGINSIADLKGKRVSVGDAGSGVEANAKQILEIYGLKFEDLNASRLSFKESASAFQDKQIDAFFVTSGVPNTAIQEVSLQNKVKVLSLEADKLKALMEKYPYYTQFVIPKDVYKTEQDATTVAIKATLIVREKLSEAEVYNMTKALFEHLDELGNAHSKGKEMSLQSSVQGVSVKFHPGAEKYFKEKGAIK